MMINRIIKQVKDNTRLIGVIVFRASFLAKSDERILPCGGFGFLGAGICWNGVGFDGLLERYLMWNLLHIEGAGLLGREDI